MLEKGSLKYVMHFLLSLVIVFIATWLYYYDSPTMVFWWNYFLALFQSLKRLSKNQKSTEFPKRSTKISKILVIRLI